MKLRAKKEVSWLRINDGIEITAKLREDGAQMLKSAIKVILKSWSSTKSFEDFNARLEFISSGLLG